MTDMLNVFHRMVMLAESSQKILPSSNVLIQQLRLKQHKQRYRQPPVPKEKQLIVRSRKK